MFRPLSLFNRNPPVPAREDYADPFMRLQREMNRLFDDSFLGLGPFRSDRADARTPCIDVREKDNAIEIDAELPGVDENDLNVEVTDNLLTISGEKKFERKEGDEGGYRVMERSYGSFSRSMTLPFAVDPERIDASFRNGVLKLVLPKPEEARNRSRKIAINKGGQSAGGRTH